MIGTLPTSKQFIEIQITGLGALIYLSERMKIKPNKLIYLDQKGE